MSRKVVYVALQQFCEHDISPRSLLEDAGWEVRENRLGRRPTRDDLLVTLQEADAVVAGVEPYDAGLLAGLPRLRCISRCGTGTDAIDLPAATARGIAVLTTPDEVVEPVAQLTLAMILSLARQLPRYLAAARERRWSKHTGVLLREWVIGLIGYGRIGQMVEQYLRPFGPRVLIADPARRGAVLPAGVEWCELDTLLGACDLVSVHASRDPSAGPLIGRAELARMRPGSFLVNTARGHLVDEQALAEALEAGRLAGAALDVFAIEPYGGPLMAFPQVICTPHIATLTNASRAAMEQRCAQNVVDFFATASVPSAASVTGRGESGEETG